MSAFNKFNQFVADLANKVHNLGADNLKVMLSNVAPVATNAIKSDITEIAAGNGYATGGVQATQVSSSQTAGVYKLILNAASWTAAGGAIANFRYVVLYNSTAANGPLIGWWDFGSVLSVANGNSFQVNFDAINGTVQLQ